MVVKDERSKLALCITAGTLQNAAHDCALEKVVLIVDHLGSFNVQFDGSTDVFRASAA